MPFRRGGLFRRGLFQDGGVQPGGGVVQRRRRHLKQPQRPANAHRPAFRLPHGQSFGQNLAAEEDERQQDSQGQRRPPPRHEHHAQGHGQHRGIGKSVAQSQGCQQILRRFQQFSDNFAPARIPFRKLRHPPPPERKKRRL